MNSAKFHMWVIEVDHEEGILYAEGHKYDEEGGIDSYGIKYQSKMEMEGLKDLLNEDDYKSMVGGDAVEGYFAGQIFDYEVSEDGKEEIILMRDERTEEEKEAAMKRAEEWAEDMRKKLKWEDGEDNS